MLHASIPEYDIRIAIIGHMQRGGSPTANDRILAGRLGFEAVESLMSGHKNVMVGFVNNQLTFTTFEDAIHKSKKPDDYWIKLAEGLGR